MSQSTKLFLTFIIAGLLLAVGLISLAQDEPTPEATEEVAQDVALD